MHNEAALRTLCVLFLGMERYLLFGLGQSFYMNSNFSKVNLRYTNLILFGKCVAR